MKLSWPYKLVLVLSALVASLSLIGVFNYATALSQLAALGPDVSVEWSGYFLPLAQVLLALVVSAVGFLGVLLGTPSRARLCALIFCIGYGLLLCARLVAVVVGASPFPGMVGTSLSVALLLALIGLVFALRPNNSFKRTRVPRAA